MADKHFELIYGKGTRSFTIPEDKLEEPLIAPREIEPLGGEVADIIRRALETPVGRPRLRTLALRKKAGVVISDAFRAGLQHELMDSLLEELIAGNPESIVVLCATGTHDPKVYAERTGEWVEAARKRTGFPIAFEPHDSEKSAFCDLGVTSRGTKLRFNRALMECDLRVYGHESKHHYLNGYSCIDKQIVPGVSSSQTVAMNHKWALHADSGPGRSPWHKSSLRQSNPFAEDVKEARQISERFHMQKDGKLVEHPVVTFGLDMVSEGARIYWIQSGSPEKICEEMVKVVDKQMDFEVKRAKYVIVSPGGPPACQALYGTQNCFDLALKGAIQKGGEALVIAPLNGRPDLPEGVSGIAPDARSKGLFFDNLVRLLPLPIEKARQEIADHFELYLWKTDRVLRLFKEEQVKIYLHSELKKETVQPGGFETAPDIQAWINERIQRNNGRFTVINDGNKLCVSGKV